MPQVLLILSSGCAITLTFAKEMKRIATIVGTVVLAFTISIFSYLKGHRDGVTQADVRSLSFEMSIFDDFGEASADDAKEKLGHLIAFRQEWLMSDLSLTESWSYWRHVDSKGFLESKRREVEAIASRYPNLALEQKKPISEQAVDGNPHQLFCYRYLGSGPNGANLTGFWDRIWQKRGPNCPARLIPAS